MTVKRKRPTKGILSLLRTRWNLSFAIYRIRRSSHYAKQTVDAGAGQSKAMREHIDEASRSAHAMETIANKIEDGNKMIMRACTTQ